MVRFRDIRYEAKAIRADIHEHGRHWSFEQWKDNMDRFKGLMPDVKQLDESDRQYAVEYINHRIDSLSYTAPFSAPRDEVYQHIEQLKGYISHYGCFTQGTLISTPQGDVRIEDLQVGDLVNTLSGPRPLKWIGYRTLTNMERWNAHEKANNYPVHILPDALGEGVPAREIRVSAWHHLYVHNVLVRAMDLVNGKTIFQQDTVREVKYFHLELDTFDVIMAHGVYSESYSDNGTNRGFYDNAVTAIRPDNLQRGGISPRPGFTVVRPNKNADVLAAIKQFTDARANAVQEDTLKATMIA